jgi:hypothetical protein
MLTSGSSPSIEVTRFGPVRKFTPKFTKEERFRWQDAIHTSDVMYSLPNVSSSKRIFFGTSTRGEDSTTIEQKKQTIGPGSYDVTRSIDKMSEYRTRTANHFSKAPRESMVMKTPSPGAVYNLRNSYWNGPDNRIAIGFNCDERKPLYTSTTSANAEPVNPQLPTGKSITIGRKIKMKSRSSDCPGPIYDVLVRFSYVLRVCTVL